MSFNLPNYDHSIRHEQKFHTHKLQKYIALFLSKPELYADFSAISPTSRQATFFRRFQTFTEKYYTLNTEKDFDGVMYFSDLHIDKLGAANITGGSGKMSNSSRKQRLEDYKQGQEYIKKIMKYFSDKYQIQFDQTHDPRVFIGHAEIWKNPSPALLEKDNWQWVAEQTYSDDKFNAPIPPNLDIDLIPIKIRNKVFQKWKKQYCPPPPTSVSRARLTPTPEEDEEQQVKPPTDEPFSPLKIDAELSDMLDEWD